MFWYSWSFGATQRDGVELGDISWAEIRVFPVWALKLSDRLLELADDHCLDLTDGLYHQHRSLGSVVEFLNDTPRHAEAI